MAMRNPRLTVANWLAHNQEVASHCPCNAMAKGKPGRQSPTTCSSFPFSATREGLGWAGLAVPLLLVLTGT